jgi:hypothetical protein
MTISTETKGYSEYIVAFLGVLGLTEAIKDSMSDAGSYANITRLLRELRETATKRTQDFHDSTTLPHIAISSSGEYRSTSGQIMDLSLLLMQ